MARRGFISFQRAGGGGDYAPKRHSGATVIRGEDAATRSARLEKNWLQSSRKQFTDRQKHEGTRDYFDDDDDEEDDLEELRGASSVGASSSR